MNPTKEVKAILGWVMNNVLSLIKHIDKTQPRFKGDQTYKEGSICCGITPEELDNRVTNVYKHMRKQGKVTFVSRDGSNHDAHQSAFLIENYDNRILSCINPILGLMGFSKGERSTIMNSLMETTTKFKWSLPKKYTRTLPINLSFRALLNGTVFSGHPARTTFGNTIRVLDANYALAKKYGYSHGYHCFQAGDDTLELINSNLVHLHKMAMKEAYAPDGFEGVHGKGEILKECTYSERDFGFLSKDGHKQGQQIFFSRQITRTFYTGAYTDTGITGEVLASSIYSQLKSTVHEDDIVFNFLHKTDKDLAPITDYTLKYKVGDHNKFCPKRSQSDFKSALELIG